MLAMNMPIIKSRGMEEHAQDGPSGPSATADDDEGILSRMGLNDNKAGMEGLDREKINKIILETSKGSKFYENELKKERQVNQRIEKMMEQKARITEQHLKTAQAQVDKMTSELERRRKLGRVIVHVDMDAFYAAVEMRDCPELKDKPMAVGSMSMLSTSNYHARRFGVRAAMPGFIAKKLCPQLVIVPLNFDKYRAVSTQVREVFADYDPNFLPMSLDEAYLDMTDHLEQRRSWPESKRTHYTSASKTEAGKDGEPPQAASEVEDLSPVLFDDSLTEFGQVPDQLGSAEVFGTSAEEAVREMRFRIEQKTSLTASAGIAPNTMLAKVCSDKNKPNGQYRIPSDHQAVIDFIQDLPVRKVPGIGKVTEKMLGALDVHTCSQLGQRMALLSLLFSETSWHHFLQISLGLGSTHIERDGERKSMSTERTFGEMSDVEEQMSLCKELCEDLAQDLLKEGLKGKTVTLKLKNVSFVVKQRASTLQCAVSSAEEIFAAAKELLRVEIDAVKPEPLRLRLMGVRVSGFVGSDDKRAQQKSIMGFLQSGGGGDLRKVGEPKPRANPVPAPAPSKAPSATPGAPRALSWGRGGEPGAPQQQSFFQRAQAQRQRLQAAHGQATEEVSEGSSRSFGSYLTTDDPVFTCTPSVGAATSSHIEAKRDQATAVQSALSTSDPVSTSATRSAAGRSSALAAITVSDSPPCTSASVSTSTRAAQQSLTCPVCFQDMQTTDLEVFNRHIDACLSTGQPESCLIREEDMLDEDSRDCPVRLYSKDADTTNAIRCSTPDAVNGEAVWHDDQEGNRKSGLLEKSSSVGVPSLVPVPADESLAILGDATPALMCPVCCQPQSTRDLAVFNRHVDVCLNREALQELQGGAPTTMSQLHAPPTSQPRGRGQPMQRAANSRGKSKRSGSPPPPPSKKSKAAAPRNTIDRFFR
ncbi:DNA polymerase kappa isoform X2 [Alosa sapidissima]|uniref:DNA polymerase kappa isoform X2 n=1 Tax=Alosa sapidissima TaxID=34773 RepID=UPI001C08BFFD|nr:DNA polymerase kappa isoform X2 [Alosa sapidissima]